MAVEVDDPGDGKRDDKKQSTSTGADEPQVTRLGDSADVARYYDKMGRIRPLSKEEENALSEIKLPPRKSQELFPAYAEYLHNEEQFMLHVQSMVDIQKSDDERQEDDDTLDELTDLIKENFVATLQGMYKYYGEENKEDFLAFASIFITERTNARVSDLQLAFSENGLFACARLKKTIKRVAGIAVASNSDKELPDEIGLYFMKLLDEDVETLRELMKGIYRDQDIHEMKGYMLRMCEMLEEMNGEGRPRRWGARVLGVLNATRGVVAGFVAGRHTPSDE